MSDLAVLIAARHEMWLNQTINNVLENAKGNTEVLVLCDGELPVEPITHHPKVSVILEPKPIGQRAAINALARSTDARYIMKLDAHCTLSPGFDLALLETDYLLGADVVQVPVQHHLHAFNWRCEACGKETYQGPTPATCPSGCGSTGPFERVIVWDLAKDRRGRPKVTTAWRFDTEPHFQYWGKFERREAGQQMFPETMSMLGACWFLEREHFWRMGGLDERHGSWGSMGLEMSCKTWLSGGRLVVNRRCWFAHLFRTQGGDFGFPYPNPASHQTKAREHAAAVWFNNQWEGQVKPLSWLVEKFAPVPDWHEEHGAARLEATQQAGLQFLTTHKPQRAAALYYTHGVGESLVLEAARAQLRRATDLPIHAVSLRPLDFGDVQLVYDGKPSRETMLKQILRGLEAMEGVDFVFFTEHDVLYDPSHFDFSPARDDRFYYNHNVWRVQYTTGQAVFVHCSQVSGMCAKRDLLIKHYRAHIEKIETRGGGKYDHKYGYEPANTRWSRNLVMARPATWMSAAPNVDIKSDTCLTRGRFDIGEWKQRYHHGWKKQDSVPGWGKTRGRVHEFLESLRSAYHVETTGVA